MIKIADIKELKLNITWKLLYRGLLEKQISINEIIEYAKEQLEKGDDRIEICELAGSSDYDLEDVMDKVNGKVVKKSRLNDVIVDGQEEYDVSIPRQRDVMAILNEDMVALRKLCEEYQREMPTQIKLIYDVAANSLNADYSYDIIYSNDKDKMAEDVLEEWYESEKSKEE